MAGVDRAQLRPCDCPGLERLGPAADGGYVVPAQHVSNAAALVSLGVKQDWAFERAFVRRNRAARVIGVDPSVTPALFARQIPSSLWRTVASAATGKRREARKQARVLARSLDYFLFFRGRHRHLALRAAASPGPSAVTLDELLSLAAPGPDQDHAVFLKIDIEGGEYALVPAVVAAARRVGVLVIEFHDIGRRAPAFNAAIASLRACFTIVHVHGNNYGGVSPDAEFPEVVELTLVNRQLAGPDRPSPHHYPRAGLDFPNQPSRPDYALRFGAEER